MGRHPDGALFVDLPVINFEATVRGGIRYLNEFDVHEWIEQCGVEADAAGCDPQVGKVVRGMADAMRRARVKAT